MKKILSTTIMTLMVVNSLNFISYANCNMNVNYKKLFNFSYIINDEEVSSITQTIGDKIVTVRRYEEIPNIKYYLERDINNEIKKLIINENSKIDPNMLMYLIKSAYDLIAHTSTAQSMALNETVSKISLDDLERLPESEKNSSATEGKNKGAKASVEVATASSALSIGVWQLAKQLAKKGSGKIAKLASKAVATPCATLTTIAAIGSAALAFGGFVYNQFYILPISNELRNLIEVYKDIYMQVYLDIINHQWMDGNVLITAVPTNTSCTKGYANFHHIDGVRYNKPQKSINWEFAKSECRFLNEDHDECYQKAKETIECLWNNQDDPSQCRNNPYYYKRNEKYALEL